MRTVYPQPGHVANEVHDLLASKGFVYTDCYTVTPRSGDPMLYTNARGNVTVVPIGGTIRKTYKSREVLVSGLRSKTKIGLEVDEQTIKFEYTDDPTFQNYVTWPKALLLGLLDGATVRRDRFFAADWAPDLSYPWIGGVQMFNGIVSGLRDVGRQSATVSVKSAINILDTQMPRDLYVPSCKNIWGDFACGIDQNAYAVTATCSGTPTPVFLPWTGGTSDYTEGKVFIDNGDSVTRVRKILKADGTGIWLVYPLDFVPVAGQMFTAFPGCAGTMTRCEFFHGANWRDRYKGFPFIPVASAAV